MDVPTYLARIRYTDPIQLDHQTLRNLQKNHMLAVPFENLDIGLGRPILLDEAALWDKIINRRRGGFCYELNGLFAWLLNQIGFEVTYLNARVFKEDGTLGIGFDHLALLVRAPGQAKHWLADVGFGDSFTEPLSFQQGGDQVQGLHAYKLEQIDDGYIAWRRNYSGLWERLYFFDLQPRKFPDDYQAGCHYHQTSPKSTFTQGSVISIATSNGRITLERMRLILTQNGVRQEKTVADENEYHALLKHYFGVVIWQ
jgi:N-hydroxyarylamine O-acetyltransferase